MGPTAAGKSAVAERIAERVGAVVVSVDSMQVYRGMDIGTAKPDAATRRRVDYRMLDLVDPEQEFSVGEYQRIGRRAIAEARAAGRPVVLVGGSGLHFRSLVDPIVPRPRDAALAARLEEMPAAEARAELLAVDPGAAGVVDLANPRRVRRALEVFRLTGETPSARAASAEAAALREYRPAIPFVGVGIDPGERLAGRIAARLDAMMARGFLEEVRGLAGRLGRTARQAVGYRELLAVVRGERTVEEGVEAARAATAALARRQRTFFRRDPRLRWPAWQDDVDHLAAEVAEIAERAGTWTS